MFSVLAIWGMFSLGILNATWLGFMAMTLNTPKQPRVYRGSPVMYASAQLLEQVPGPVRLLGVIPLFHCKALDAYIICLGLPKRTTMSGSKGQSLSGAIARYL